MAQETVEQGPREQDIMDKGKIIYLKCSGCNQKIGTIRLGRLGVDKDMILCGRCMTIIEVPGKEGQDGNLEAEGT